MKVSHAIVLLLAMVACIYLLSLTPPAYQADPVALSQEGELKIQLDIRHGGSDMLLPGAELEKSITVKNVEQQPAWVWITCALPASLNGGEGESVHLEASSSSGWKEPSSVTQNIDGTEYTLYTMLYSEPLAGGSDSAPCGIKLSIAPEVIIDPAGEWHLQTEDGSIPLGWNFADPIILFDAYAIQQLDIPTVERAYAIYNHQ